ncbi:MAG: tetratricopeptide repeat protein [Bryobacteraceae bacterium]
MKHFRIFILAACPLFAANKEMVELQRDVASLQDQVRSVNDKLIALTSLVQQAVENTRQSSTAIAVMQSNFADTLKRQQEGVVGPVVTVGTKLDQMSDDFKAVRESVLDMNSRLGKLDAKMSDLQNVINVMKNPPAPPPSAETIGTTPMNPATPVGTSPTMSRVTGGPVKPPAGMQAETTYTSAYRDYVGGSYDLAMQEFNDYLKYYGTTQFAPNAQYYIGDIYFHKKDYDNAVQAFDAVLEHFQDNSKTADAHLMKGRSLMALGRRDAAAREFREITSRYSSSEAAPKAKSYLRELGLSAGDTPAKPTRARRR